MKKKALNKGAKVGAETVVKQHSTVYLLPFIYCAILLAAFLLIFSGLGHYSLWDDEAVDAMGAKSVMQTGDTFSMVGPNIMGYRNGLLQKNLRTEGEPPFSSYLAAASMKMLGDSSFAVRFPFALCGFACIGVILWWMWKWRASTLTVIFFGCALLGNVSLLLYSRQCHYYIPSAFFFTAIAFLYLHWNGNRWKLLIMGICSALLMSANYSFYLVMYGCLFADYLVWQQKKRRFKLTDVLLLFAPQLLMGLVLLAWWNPFHTQIGNRFAHDTLQQRLILLCWECRDMNRCEFFVGILLMLAPVLAFTSKNTWLKRALLAAGLFLLGMTFLSTQTVTDTTVADVRYFSAIIPLFLAIEVFTLRALTATATPWLAIPLALVAFGTNLFNGGPLLWCGARSTILTYIGELANPPSDPYTIATNWINDHVHDGESIWTVPDYTAYPLMFHAPKAVYAWQLAANNHDPQFSALPPIHFQGRAMPNYILVFGPAVRNILQLTNSWRSQGVIYEQLSTIDFFWKDMYRPELFWRTFKPITGYNKEYEAIYVFKLTSS